METLLDYDLAVSVYINSLLKESLDCDLEAIDTDVAGKAGRSAPAIVVEPAVPVENHSLPLPTHPAWAQSRFRSMMFNVRGVSLAVPLIKLCGIHRLTANSNITFIPHAPSWMLGLMPYRGKNVKIVDTAALIFPEGHAARSAVAPDEEATHVILIDDGRWGLMCHGIGEILFLEQEQVRWRTDRTRRTWLAGTVVKEMCALLDVDEFLTLLEKRKPN